MDESVARLWKLCKHVKLFLVRHGQQAWKAKLNSFRLPETDAHLTLRGIEQAVDAGQLIRAAVADTDRVRIISSDMLRARQTARHILSQLPAAELRVYATEKQVSYDQHGYELKQVLRGIREQYFGNYERVADSIYCDGDVPAQGCLPDAETDHAVAERMLLAMEEILTQCVDDGVQVAVIVTHFHATKILLSLLCKFNVHSGEGASYSLGSVLCVVPDHVSCSTFHTNRVMMPERLTNA